MFPQCRPGEQGINTDLPPPNVAMPVQLAMMGPAERQCLALFQLTEGNFTVGLTPEGEMRLLDNIEEVAVPVVHSTMPSGRQRPWASPGTLSIRPPPLSAWAAKRAPVLVEVGFRAPAKVAFPRLSKPARARSKGCRVAQ